MTCSECNSPLTGPPCGFLHAVMRIQIAAIQQITEAIMRGGSHG